MRLLSRYWTWMRMLSLAHAPQPDAPEWCWCGLSIPECDRYNSFDLKDPT